MMAIIAKGNIIHNGANYKAGDEILGLKKEEAQRLIDLQVAEDDKAPKANKTADEQ